MSCPSSYCVRNTGFSILNDIYNTAGTHNGQPSWQGVSNNYYIFYKSTTSQWCLSNVLNGNCLLSGKSPCTTECPDFFSEYITGGICPTPTPSVTTCNLLDFESYFDCEGYFCLSPTPTKTPTQTPTPTSNNTITCTINVDATLVSVSVTPTKTPTQTPTSSGIFSRDCTFLGDVLFNTINVNLNCPISKKFSDCNNPNNIYSTTDTLINPSGGNLTENMIFNAIVNGTTKCITYLGLSEEIIGGDSISLKAGPIGSCSSCSPTSTPTKTPSQTPTNTPSPTVTPSITPTRTPTKTPTPTRTPTKTQTPTNTPTKTPTPTKTLS